MEYIQEEVKMVKILMNVTLERLVRLISKYLYIDCKWNNIQITMKPRNVNNKKSIMIMDDEDVNCFIDLSHQLKECILVYVTSASKSRNAFTKITNYDVQQPYNDVEDDDGLQGVQTYNYVTCRVKS